MWGGVGLGVLIFVFGASPTSPPIDVMLTIIAVITAASVMEAAGGIGWLVGIAERVIRANPQPMLSPSRPGREGARTSSSWAVAI